MITRVLAVLTRYLSQVLGGQEPTQLSQGSAAKVLEMIEKVQRIASRSLDVKKTSYHLSKKLRACLQPFDKMVRGEGEAAAYRWCVAGTVEAAA